ncbi:hypothetical protein ETAA8_53450 [Anatilimnocola aggregata]|uniref:Uncharacterized protein n=1 Tax=Anatilimnocola aggregata TaxID=2528021 RepID=A0A517YJ26_9BACT|nr:hypothetical protein [Anatilimnocola aggregata]QDU30226.1 hypothetical protein ETAA8_53450 [Anatilimnocola aggregata]
MLPAVRNAAVLAVIAITALLCTGCAAIPDRHVHPVYHNPFPQLHRIAILPFFNQSKEPTVDGDELAIAYYNELQNIPGFEVMPVGVSRRFLQASKLQPRTSADFQELARLMHVDAIIVGSVTEYSPYYPPRIGLSVDWYAANPGFHPIPAGYGLPWGTAEEEFIPSALVREAEFALAREQLKTQTPKFDDPALRAAPASGSDGKIAAKQAPSAESAIRQASATTSTDTAVADGHEPTPPWPDPRGFIPLGPTENPPDLRPQYDPIITHTRIYHGQDSEFTQRLEHYYETRDDARFGGWQTYLQRPSDFIRFCCYLHVTETLAARGGAGESRVAWRWPISR